MKMAPTTCFILFFLILSLSINSTPTYAATPYRAPRTEAEALLAFKARLTDPKNYLQSWDASLVTPCTWFHVTCDQNDKVVSVDLGIANLSGNLAPEIGLLSSLKYLRLNRNNIDGAIPAELGKLNNLEVLDLGGNKLSGKIPVEISKIPLLRVADFSNNGNLCWNFWPTLVFRGSYNLCQRKMI